METVYILLTRSTTIVSRFVGIFTGDKFTHAALSCDRDLKTLCSFSRRHPALLLPAGLMTEQLRGGYYQSHCKIPCALLILYVDDSTYGALQKRLSRMLLSRKRYHYHILGLLRCRLGLKSYHPTKYFCSRFVAELLEESGAVTLPKDASLMRPQDFLSLPEVTCVFQGRLKDLLYTLPEETTSSP